MTDNATTHTLPKDLTIMAWAFIALGALSLITTLASFFISVLPQIDFLMILVLIGWGLMRCKPFFRLMALTCAAVMLVFYGLPLLLIAFGTYSIVDATAGQRIVFWLQSILATGFGAWAVFVLNKPSIKRLFES